jgi:hypothetical protein
VTETRHRARGGVNRQGRGKRRRRNEADVEIRDEVTLERHGASRDGKGQPGSGFLGLGAPKGKKTPGKDGRGQGSAFVGRTGTTDGEAVTRSSRASARPGVATNRTGNRPGGCSAENARVQAARQEGHRRGREATRAATPGSQTLKVDATLRRISGCPGLGEG